VQEGDAEVLLQARFNEADGDPANAGTVFERANHVKAITTQRLTPQRRVSPIHSNHIIESENPFGLWGACPPPSDMTVRS